MNQLVKTKFIVMLTSAFLAPLQAFAVCLSENQIGGAIVMENHCPYHIDYEYCVTSPSGGGYFSCNAHNFGGGGIGPGGEDEISVYGAGPTYTVHWMECAPSASNPNPLAIARGYRPGYGIVGFCSK